MMLIIVNGGLFLILYAFGIVPYVVLSGSMEPTIETGSVCFINKHADYDSIKEDDIIAFQMKNGPLVTHRVVEVTDSGLTTKGDNNTDIDGSFQSTKGRIIIITCIVLLFVSGLLFGEDKKKKEDN